MLIKLSDKNSAVSIVFSFIGLIVGLNKLLNDKFEIDFDMQVMVY